MFASYTFVDLLRLLNVICYMHYIYTQTSPKTARQHSRKYCCAFKHHECIVTARTQDTMWCPTHGDINSPTWLLIL